MKVLVVLSGGQDSTTVLFDALVRHSAVHCVTFDYNQRHQHEVRAACSVITVAQTFYKRSAITHEVIELGAHVLHGTSPLVSSRPLDQYEHWTQIPDGIEKTFVPMRNQLFLTIAANRAVEHRCSIVYAGMSQEDSGGYPDCRDGFVFTLNNAINQSLDGVWAVELRCPLMHKTKAETVLWGMQLPGCMEALAFTHTAYDGAYPPTGKDHATLLRAKGFAEANVPDPLVVRAIREGKMDAPASANYDHIRVSMDEELRREMARRRGNVLRD